MEPHGCQKDNRTVVKKVTVSYQKDNRGNLKGKNLKILVTQRFSRLQKWNQLQKMEQVKPVAKMEPVAKNGTTRLSKR